ncbi:hypothetical protein [Anaerobutyricum hallii]|uniref:hypothetical protein n=1 Tax=Anaerobutyricum hallii TaxID=39488 RepID=UPI002432CF91|nr:hypothetical protein [Anaerobutyricum hallii]
MRSHPNLAPRPPIEGIFFSGCLLFELNRGLSFFGESPCLPQARICHSVYRNFGVTSKYIYKSKNKIKIMPKNLPKYLDKLKECKNISHIFIDNLKGRIYNRK